MSWADDIRCLFCDGRLPLYRKITNGQFCSTAHRKAYWQEQENLAVERLHQTHSSLRAYRPPGPIEAILGPEEPAYEAFDPSQIPEPVMAGSTPPPEAAATPAVDPVETERPSWLLHANAGEVPIANFLPSSAFPRPYWLPDSLAGAEPEPFVRPNALRRPVNVYHFEDLLFTPAGTLGIPVEGKESDLVFASDIRPVPIASHPVHPQLVLEPPSQENDLRKLLEAGTDVENDVKDDAPPVHPAIPLAAPGPRSYVPAAFEPLPVSAAARPVSAHLASNLAPAPTVLSNAGLRRLPIELVALVPGPWIDSLRAFDLRAEVENPQFVLSTPPVRPRLRLATGRRYAVPTTRETPPAVAESAEFAASTLPVSLPERKVKILRAPAGRPSAPVQPALPPNFEPNPTGLLPLACANKPSQPADVHPAPSSTSIPQPLRTEPMRPVSHLEPMEPPVIPADVLAAVPGDVPPAFLITPPPYTRPEPAAEATRVHVWTHAIDFWNRAPRDLKLLAFALPLLLGLALHPRLPKVRVAAPTGIQQNMEHALNTQWTNVRQTLVDRAAVALDEDFRSGLDDWVSRGDAPTDWSFDATGFVKPGPLAMYRPSLGLADYQLQFLGLIDKQALSWIVRAADFENFYVVKLVVVKPGPLPTIGITRYAVVNGKADSRVDTVVRIDARTDMLYRVRMDLQGSDFTLLVQGQMVDSWSEPRLRHGGVGFFSARGEESRLRWVQVTHQYDMLGRLCAYLAPYNMSAAGGGSSTPAGTLQQ